MMAHSLSRAAVPLDAAKVRLRLYAVLAVGFFLLAVALGRADGPREGMRFNLVTSDGRSYYAYLTSLVIDGDLDFANEIRDHWGQDFHPEYLDMRTERGFVQNKFPIGMPLTLAPLFLLAHGLSLALYALTGSGWFTPDGYSLLYQVCCLAEILALSWAALALMDGLLVRRFGVRGRFAAAGVGLASVGTNLAWYCFREPFMVHVVSLFWCTLAIVLADRVLGELDGRRLSRWALPLLSLAAMMAVLCRPTNVFLLPFLVCVLLRAWQTGMAGALAARLPSALVGLVPLLLQMAVWRHTTGHWLSYSYREEGFVWSRPALWQTLFSSRHGLLFWSPLVLLALAGFAGRLWRRGPDRLLLCYLAAFAILWYCNSAWHMWWFGAAFGARAFVELSSLFVLGLAFALEDAWAQPRRGWRLGQAAFVLLAVGYNWVLMWLYFKRCIPHNDYLF